MADFSKYVGKVDNNLQNWSKIGKDISTDLKKIMDERQTQRATIDKKTREAVDEVNNVQLGQNKTFNEFLLNGSGQTKEFLLMQEKLLKQGVLKPQEYLNSRQIISDDWANLSEAAKSFNTDYEAAMTRIQDGSAAMQEMYQNEKYDAFRNIQDKSIFVNPVDGRMYLTTTDGDGNIERDPASMINVNAINARRQDKINKFNVVEQVTNATGALGEVVKALNKDGVITRTDKRLSEMMLIGGVQTTFDDAKKDIIASLMTSPRNNASILTDSIGGYNFTEVASEAGGKNIYLKENGMGLLEPQLTDDQLDAVRNKIDMEIEKQLGFQETSSYEADLRAKTARQQMYNQRKIARMNKDDKEKAAITAYGYAVDVASGDPAASSRSLKALALTHPDLVFTPHTGGDIGYTIYNKVTGNTSSVQYSGKGTELDYADQIYAALVGGGRKEEGLESIEVARTGWSKQGNKIGKIQQGKVGTSEQALPKLSVGGLKTSQTDAKGKFVTVNTALTEGDKLKSASDFTDFTTSIEIPGGYGINLSDYVTFDEGLHDYEVVATYGDKELTFDPSFKKEKLTGFLGDALNDIIKNENKERAERSKAYKTQSAGGGKKELD